MNDSANSADLVWRYVGVCRDCHQAPCMCRQYGARLTSTSPVQPAGVKNDSGKPKMSMLFSKALKPAIISVIRVLEYGAVKYPGEDNWAKVEDGVNRYRDAALRHLSDHCTGARTDESGLPHLAHAACSVLFALALEIADEQK